MNGTTDISPLGQMAPGLVVPKFDVPMNGLTKSTGSVLGACAACNAPKWHAMHKAIMRFFFIFKRVSRVMTLAGRLQIYEYYARKARTLPHNLQ